MSSSFAELFSVFKKNNVTFPARSDHLFRNFFRYQFFETEFYFYCSFSPHLEFLIQIFNQYQTICKYIKLPFDMARNSIGALLVSILRIFLIRL